MPAKKSAAKPKGKAKELVRVVDNESPTASIEAVEGENNQTFAWTLKKKFMFTSIQKKFTNIFLRQLQLLQAEITTNTSSPVAG
jgi:hypothetical protein